MAKSIELRSFTHMDWQGLAGAEKFANGNEPMLGTTEHHMAVADGHGVQIFFSGTDETWSWTRHGMRQATYCDLARVMLQWSGVYGHDLPRYRETLAVMGFDCILGGE